MCRNIRPLYNLDPPVIDSEVEAAALQFVRKVSGYTRPSAANQAAFDRAVADVTRTMTDLLANLETAAPPKSREELAQKARERSARRFAS